MANDIVLQEAEQPADENPDDRADQGAQAGEDGAEGGAERGGTADDSGGTEPFDVLPQLDEKLAEATAVELGHHGPHGVLVWQLILGSDLERGERASALEHLGALALVVVAELVLDAELFDLLDLAGGADADSPHRDLVIAEARREL